MNQQYEYRQGYMEIVCPDGQSYDAFLAEMRRNRLYTCISSHYGSLTIRIYFQEWVAITMTDEERDAQAEWESEASLRDAESGAAYERFLDAQSYEPTPYNQQGANLFFGE